MGETLYVFKVGGGVIEEEEKLASFIKSFSALQGKKILIHGGGKVATRMATDLGIETQMIEGRRITDKAMLDVVTMTYAGKVNKNITARLLASNQKAVGIAGLDGGLITSVKRPLKNNIDYGFVGDVVAVNPDLVYALLAQDFIPVIAPLTADKQGQILNTNADTIASELASSLSERYSINLIYVFELDGVMEHINDPESLVKEINRHNYAELKKDGKITNGMIPKLDNAFDAIDKGVSQVTIIHYAKVQELNNQNFDRYTKIK